MRLQAELQGKTISLEIKRESDHVVATVDGRQYALEVSQPEPGVYLLKIAGRVFEAFISSSEDKSAPTEINIHGIRHELYIRDPRRLKALSEDSSHDHGLVEIRSAMPGKVVRILSTADQPILKGEGVIVVEAMKMQNELKSPKDGTVREIRVSESDTVEAGQILAVIE